MKLRAAVVLGMLAACSKTPDPTPAASAEPAGPMPGEHAHKRGDKREPVLADAPPLALDITVAGQTTTYHKDAFDKVARYTVGSDGEGRDSWSLRELATTLVGPGARVVSVTGADGPKPMAAADWTDATRTPILHTTRRGTLKLTWADAKGVWGETVVKDVTRVEIAK